PDRQIWRRGSCRLESRPRRSAGWAQAFRKLVKSLFLGQLSCRFDGLGGHPCRERRFDLAMRAGDRVMPLDRSEPLGRDDRAQAYYRRPDSTVYQRHLAIHEPEANYVRRVSDSVDRGEDRVARWMGPPTPRDGFARDQLCDVGD